MLAREPMLSYETSDRMDEMLKLRMLERRRNALLELIAGILRDEGGRESSGRVLRQAEEDLQRVEADLNHIRQSLGC